ncbi:Protein RCN-1 [Aphelenchoides avenae]|nr:Protein RCN-1 [Aphelenchus avenae]
MKQASIDEEEVAREISHKDDLPTSIIIRDVPEELYTDPVLKQNFSDMFKQIEPSVRIDYLKGFRRVRAVFAEPEHATAAKLLIEHHNFNGKKMKAFFAQNIKLTKRAYQDEEGHLMLPPLEKQFLISPPTSPPVGWTQVTEMPPVVCDFDLMARLAAYTVDDKYEVHSGDEQQPSIIVTPVTKGEYGDDDSQPDTPSSGHIPRDATGYRPHTPRPPLPED